MSIEITQTGQGARGWRLLAIFVVLGFVLSVVTVRLTNTFESLGVIGALCLLLLFVPAAILGISGLRQGARYLPDFKAHWGFGHTLIFLLFVSTLVFRVRDVSAATNEPLDAWTLLRIGPEALVAILLIKYQISHRMDWLRSLFQGIVGALAVYGLVCAASSTWSVYGPWTLYKSLEFLLDLSVMAAILAMARTAEDMRQILNWTWSLYALELVWTWIGAAIWPADALDELGRLSGIWPVVASNSIGVSSAIICVVALARLLSRSARKSDRSWYVLLLGFGVISLVASQTRNSIAGLIFGIAIILICERRIWMGVVGTAVAVPALFLTSIGPRIYQYILRDQTESQVEGLSSRMDWWTYAWQQFMHHPLTGLGAYAAGKFAVLGKLGVGVASQMHSDWMEVLAGTSLWGLIPFLAALVACWWVLVRSFWDRSLTPDERQLSTETLAVLGVITLRSFFNVELSWHAPFLYFAVVGYAEFLRRKRKSLIVTRPVSVSVAPQTVEYSNV